MIDPDADDRRAALESLSRDCAQIRALVVELEGLRARLAALADERPASRAAASIH